MTGLIGGLDHVSLHVAEVERSKYFYKEVIGLTEVPRPAFDFRGAWFALGKGQTLHLIEGRQERPQWGSRATHIAFAVVDIQAAAAYFREKGIEHTPIKPRPDGIRQFFITDPDGYWLEFCQAWSDNRG